MYSKVEAAYIILKKAGKPMHVDEIIDIAIKKKMILTIGKTPTQTLYSDILKENKIRAKRNRKGRFVKMGRSTFGLKEFKKKP